MPKGTDWFTEESVTETGLACLELDQLRRLVEGFFFKGETAQTLNLKDFISAFWDVVGELSGVSDQDLRDLFIRVDTDASGTIDWYELADYFRALAEGESKRRSDKKRLFQSEGVTRHLEKSLSHRACISRILAPPSLDKYYTASEDGVVKVWNASTLDYISTLHNGNVCCNDLCYFPRSDTLAVASEDSLITLYNTRTGKARQTLKGKKTLIPSKTLEVTRRKQFRVARDRSNDSFFGLDASALKGSRVLDVLQKSDNSLLQRLWARENVYDTFEVGVVPAMVAPTTSLCCLSSEKSEAELLLAGLRDGKVQLYNISSVVRPTAPPQPHGAGKAALEASHLPQTHHPTHSWQPHDGAVTALHPFPDKEHVFTAGLDSDIHICNAERCCVVKTLPGLKKGGTNTLGLHAKGVFGFDYSQELKMVVSVGLERHALVWNPFVSKPLAELSGHMGRVVSAVFNSRDYELATLSLDNYVRVWDVRNYRVIQTLREVHPRATAGLGCMVYDSQRGALVTGSSVLYSRSLSRVANSQANPTSRTAPPELHNEEIRSLLISRLQNVLVTADSATVRVWCLETQTLLSWFDVPDGVAAVCLDSDQRRLLVANSETSNVQIWNLGSGQILRELSDGSEPNIAANEAGVVYAVLSKQDDHSTEGTANLRLIVAAGCESVRIFLDDEAHTTPWMVVPLKLFGGAVSMSATATGTLILGSSRGKAATLNLYNVRSCPRCRVGDIGISEGDSLVFTEAMPATMPLLHSLLLAPLHPPVRKDIIDAERVLEAARMRAHNEHDATRRRPTLVADSLRGLETRIEHIVDLSWARPFCVAAGGDGVLRLVDAQSLKVVTAWRGVHGRLEAIYSLAVNQTRQLLISGDEHGYVQTYDMSGVRGVRTSLHHDDSVHHVAPQVRKVGRIRCFSTPVTCLVVLHSFTPPCTADVEDYANEMHAAALCIGVHAAKVSDVGLVLAASLFSVCMLTPDGVQICLFEEGMRSSVSLAPLIQRAAADLAAIRKAVREQQKADRGDVLPPLLPGGGRLQPVETKRRVSLFVGVEAKVATMPFGKRRVSGIVGAVKQEVVTAEVVKEHGLVRPMLPDTDAFDAAMHQMRKEVLLGFFAGHRGNEVLSLQDLVAKAAVFGDIFANNPEDLVHKIVREMQPSEREMDGARLLELTPEGEFQLVDVIQRELVRQRRENLAKDRRQLRLSVVNSLNGPAAVEEEPTRLRQACHILSAATKWSAFASPRKRRSVQPHPEEAPNTEQDAPLEASTISPQAVASLEASTLIPQSFLELFTKETQRRHDVSSLESRECDEIALEQEPILRYQLHLSAAVKWWVLRREEVRGRLFAVAVQQKNTWGTLWAKVAAEWKTACDAAVIAVMNEWRQRRSVAYLTSSAKPLSAQYNPDMTHHPRNYSAILNEEHHKQLNRRHQKNPPELPQCNKYKVFKQRSRSAPGSSSCGALRYPGGQTRIGRSRSVPKEERMAPLQLRTALLDTKPHKPSTNPLWDDPLCDSTPTTLLPGLLLNERYQHIVELCTTLEQKEKLLGNLMRLVESVVVPVACGIVDGLCSESPQYRPPDSRQSDRYVEKGFAFTVFGVKGKGSVAFKASVKPAKVELLMNEVVALSGVASTPLSLVVTYKGLRVFICAAVPVAPHASAGSFFIDGKIDATYPHRGTIDAALAERITSDPPSPGLTLAPRPSRLRLSICPKTEPKLRSSRVASSSRGNGGGGTQTTKSFLTCCTPSNPDRRAERAMEHIAVLFNVLPYHVDIGCARSEMEREVVYHENASERQEYAQGYQIRQSHGGVGTASLRNYVMNLSNLLPRPPPVIHKGTDISGHARHSPLMCLSSPYRFYSSAYDVFAPAYLRSAADKLSSRLQKRMAASVIPALVDTLSECPFTTKEISPLALSRYSKQRGLPARLFVHLSLAIEASFTSGKTQRGGTTTTAPVLHGIRLGQPSHNEAVRIVHKALFEVNEDEDNPFTISPLEEKKAGMIERILSEEEAEGKDRLKGIHGANVSLAEEVAARVLKHDLQHRIAVLTTTKGAAASRDQEIAKIVCTALQPLLEMGDVMNSANPTSRRMSGETTRFWSSVLLKFRTKYQDDPIPQGLHNVGGIDFKSLADNVLRKLGVSHLDYAPQAKPRRRSCSEYAARTRGVPNMVPIVQAPLFASASFVSPLHAFSMSANVNGDKKGFHSTENPPQNGQLLDRIFSQRHAFVAECGANVFQGGLRDTIVEFTTLGKLSGGLAATSDSGYTTKRFFHIARHLASQHSELLLTEVSLESAAATMHSQPNTSLQTFKRFLPILESYCGPLHLRVIELLILQARTALILEKHTEATRLFMRAARRYESRAELPPQGLFRRHKRRRRNNLPESDPEEAHAAAFCMTLRQEVLREVSEGVSSANSEGLQQAETIARDAVAAYREGGEVTEPSLARGLLDAIRICIKREHTVDVMAMLKEATSLCERLYGTHSAGSAEATSLMGDFHRAGGAYDTAFRAHWSAMNAHSRLSSAHSPAVVKSYISLALVVYATADPATYEPCLALLGRGLKLAIELKGDTHPLVLQCLEVVGKVKAWHGKIEDAIDVFEYVLKHVEAKQSGKPVATILYKLAALFHEAGHLDEALSLQASVGTMFGEIYGERSLQVADVSRAMAECYDGVGKTQKACEHLQKSLDIYDTLPHSETVASEILRVNLLYAELLLKDGKSEAAAVLLERSLGLDKEMGLEDLHLTDERALLHTCREFSRKQAVNDEERDKSHEKRRFLSTWLEGMAGKLYMQPSLAADTSGKIYSLDDKIGA